MSAFLRTLTGKNKTGQILYGFLDIAPIPPIHNLIRMAVKDKIPTSQIPSFVWQRLDKLRLTTSVLAIALAFAVTKGYITLELAIEFLKTLAIILS